MAENPDPPAPEPSELPATALPRRQFDAERQVRANTPNLGEQVADLTETVRALAQHVAGEAVVNQAEAGAERGGRRVKKFTRSSLPDDRPLPVPGDAPAPAEPDARKEAAPPPAPGETRKTEAAEFNRNVAWPRTGQAEAAEEASARPPRRKRRNRKVILLGIQGVGLALLALGYLLGRSDAPGAGTHAAANLPAIPNPDEVNVDVGVGERDLAAIGTALHTARTGDKKEATRLLSELGKRAVVPGLEYQLGKLAFEQGDLVRGDRNLDLSRHAGEFFAASCYVQAREYAGQGHQDSVPREFNYAVHAEPFNGRYFFYYAEVLRRDGHTQKALDFFEAARDRSHTESEEALYVFKERLAKVEAGSDAAFNAELDEHLKEQPSQPEWLMLAAVRSINARAFPAAAGFLKQAASATPPAVYNLWVKDFVFRTVSEQPALAELLQRPPVPGSTEEFNGFVDPTVSPTEWLDPGIWPVGKR